MKPAPRVPPTNSRNLMSGSHILAASDAPPRLQLDNLPGVIYLARGDGARTIIEMTGAVLPGGAAHSVPFELAPLMHPEERDQVLEVIQAAVAENQAFAVEYRLREAAGGWRTVWEQGRPVGMGQHTFIQGQLLDVSDRTQREQARLATELRLLQLQNFHALNELAGGVAHEFNNLIAGILGSAELVAMDVPPGHPAHETLKQIFEASNQARDFVAKLRVLGQRPNPEFKSIRLQPVLEECVQILRTIIPAKVELEAEINPDCPMVNADPAQIHQAMLDLCLYAWQGLADRRGRIKISLTDSATVRPPAGMPSRLQRGPHVCLTVQDDSPGLDKHAREHLFHPFRIRRAGGKKIGLELFLVREAVRGHNGDIFVESEPGSGVTFRAYLPVAEEK